MSAWSSVAERIAERVHGRVTRLVGVRWSLDAAPGAIALTFDDGPAPTSTRDVLDVLDRHGVRATFFVTGASALRHPDLVREAESRGHRIGSHSMTHPFVAHCRLRQIVREYRDGRRAVERVVGHRVRLFRPPGSDLGYRSLFAMWLLRLQPYLASNDPEDWQPGTTTDDIVGCLATACAGDIVLLHDSIELPVDERALDRSRTVDAIDRYLSSHGRAHRFACVGGRWTHR